MGCKVFEYRKKTIIETFDYINEAFIYINESFVFINATCIYRFGLVKGNFSTSH